VAENVQNVTLEILKNIQSGITEIHGRLDRLDARIEEVATGMRKDRRNVAGILVMMRATAGEFDERISEVEERMARLESRAQ
jgi:uncharacterized protein YukE